MQSYNDTDLMVFSNKNLSNAKNTTFSVLAILFVLIAAAECGHSTNATAQNPNADSVFYRINTSIRSMEKCLWNQSVTFLKKKKKKLSKTKCYLTVDETYDSYTGHLHKKKPKTLSKTQKEIHSYIHNYKPKRGDTGSFKYLVFALVYGNRRRVLYVKSLKRNEKYLDFVVSRCKKIYSLVKFEVALFDRGFYVGEFDNSLRKTNLPFIIRARICDNMKKIYGIYFKWRTYDYNIAEKYPTRLSLGKDELGRKYAFISNLEKYNSKKILFLYRKRWNIENVFKATDGIQLRVATSNHVTRMFAVCISFIIYNGWQNRNKKPALYEHIRKIFLFLLDRIQKSFFHWKDKLRLKIPLWDFVIKID